MNKQFFENIIYIGDDAADCRYMIDLFNNALLEIEQAHCNWFLNRPAQNPLEAHDRLQSHIYYHFEGNMAIFKFRRQEELPRKIVNDCIEACNQIALEQACFAA